jgi:hypothetical protein
MMKPGASVTDIVAQTNTNYWSLTTSDVIVLHGGSNDVYRNNSNVALLQIVKFIQDINNTNIIVLDIPQRYDLGKNSCVNKEIQSFKQKLRKITKLFKHVSVLEVSSNREDFTKYGLQLNRVGKRLISKQIATESYRLMEKIVYNPVSLEWKSVSNGNLIDSEMVKPAPPGSDNLEVQHQNHLTNIKQINNVAGGYTFWCFLSSLCDLNDLLHTSQQNGLSPLCERWCLLSSL